MGIRATLVRSALLAVAVAAARSEAASLTVSSADQLCTPLAITCTIGDVVTVIDGSTLDFGIRHVDLIDKGRLHSGSGGMNIRCESFHAYGSTDGAAIYAKETVDGLSQGGFVSIEATKGCSDAEAHCLEESDCSLGACGVRRCSLRKTHLCNGDADCTFGTCMANRRCSLSAQHRCNTNGDCSYGTCPTQATCPSLASGPQWPDGVVPCDENADCEFGSCSRGSGVLDLDAIVSVAADVPGVFLLRAAGPVTLHRDVEATAGAGESGGDLEIESLDGDVTMLGGLHATGAAGGSLRIDAGGRVEIDGDVDIRGGAEGGGELDVRSKGGFLLTGRLLASSMTTGGEGGRLFLASDEDVVFDASGLTATATQVQLHGADGPYWTEGGSGGELIVDAGRDIVIGSPSRLSLRGALPDGIGGTLDMVAGRDLLFDGIVEAAAASSWSTGGLVVLEGVRDARFTSGSRVDLSGGGQGNGGSFFLVAGNEALFDGVVDIRGGNFQESDGDIDVSACSLRVGPNADLEVRAPGADNILAGADHLVIEAGAKLFSKTGDNELRYRSAAHPPIVSGSLTPVAKLVLDPDLPTCGCGDGLPDEGEECDGGPSPYAMGRACRDDCTRIPYGHPTDSKGPLPATADVLFTLRASLSGSPCDLRVCDADGSGHVSVRDVLRLLRASVGVATSLDCPA
jgi:hypothetical protein